jgi:hypothetical protein
MKHILPLIENGYPVCNCDCPSFNGVPRGGMRGSSDAVGECLVTRDLVEAGKKGEDRLGGDPILGFLENKDGLQLRRGKTNIYRGYTCISQCTAALAEAWKQLHPLG